MDLIVKAARRNPLGACCAATVAVAFYAGPTYGMYADAGWWSLLIEPAMVASIGVLMLAVNFVASL